MTESNRHPWIIEAEAEYVKAVGEDGLDCHRELYIAKYIEQKIVEQKEEERKQPGLIRRILGN